MKICDVAPGAGDVNCIQDRADIVFFAGTRDDSPEPETKYYFEQARTFFGEKLPTVHQHSAINLAEIIEALNTDTRRGKLPWGEVYIVAHASTRSWSIRTGAGDGIMTIGFTLADLIRLRKFQETTPDPPRPLPRIRPGVMDWNTRLILKSCEIGRNHRMLDAISSLFGGWCEVRAPKSLLWFRKNAQGDNHERLFRHVEIALLPGVVQAPPTTPGQRGMVVEQLIARNPALPPAKIEALVSEVKSAWKTGTQQPAWIKLTPPSSSSYTQRDIRFVVNVLPDTGALYWEGSVEPDWVDRDGFKVGRPSQRVDITKIDDEAMVKSAQNSAIEVTRQVFAQDRLLPHQKLDYWHADRWSVQAFARVAGANNKYYQIQCTLAATGVEYYQMVGDFDPDVNNPDHYGVSTINSRFLGGYYDSYAYKGR
jgi:hypothetical protein